MLLRDIQAAWQHVMEVLSPSHITRVGLRYIIRIELTSVEDLPGSWIRPNDYVATAVLESKPGFLSRVEVVLDTQNTTIVTLSHQRSDSPDFPDAVVFDIDHITQREMSANGGNLLQEIDRLHEDVWQVFETAKSDRLELHLQGRPA
jgi:uncharacterized protein (TIGR04255 family)